MNFFDKFKFSHKKPEATTPEKTPSNKEETIDSLLEDAKKDLPVNHSFEQFTNEPFTQEEIDKLLSFAPEDENLEDLSMEDFEIKGGVSSEDLAEVLENNQTPELAGATEQGLESRESLSDKEKEDNSSWEKFTQKMKEVYESAKEISGRDIKTFFTKERESQIVETGGKITYDTLGTIAGTKFISDLALFGLHKAGVKSSMKGDIHKYFAENDMERALVGIVNRSIEMRKIKESKKNKNETDYNISFTNSKEDLKKAALAYRDKIANLNVSQEKKDGLMKEFRLIMRDHKSQELLIAKGESEKFDQAMRHYTGNKVSGLKIGKDAMNSALSLSGFYALRGASYLGFSALEKGKETWDKKSHELYQAKKEAIKKTKNTEDMPDWETNYWQDSGEKFKEVLKGITISSAKETYNELVHGRKEGKSAEMKERKDNFKVEKNANIEKLKQQLEDEGVGLFGKTWRVNWEKVKNINPETIRENLVRLQALGKIARVAGVSLIGYQAYETDGGIFKGAYDKFLDNLEKEGVWETVKGNAYGNFARLADAYDKMADKISDSKIFDLKTWQNGLHGIADKFHHADAQTGQTDLEKEFQESEGIKHPIPRVKETTPVANTGEKDTFESGEASGASSLQEKNNHSIEELRDKINLARAAHNTPGAAPMTLAEEQNIQKWEKELGELSGGDKLENVDKHFPIAEKVVIKRGDSIWTIAEKHLEGNKDFHDLKGFLRVYNIDRVKDTVVAHPEKYGLKPGFNPLKMSAKQIQEINWQQAFDDTFKDKGVTTHLPKGYRDGGGHHHGVSHYETVKPSSEAGKGEYVKDNGTTPISASSIPEKHIEVPPVDDSKIYVDSNLVIEKGSQFADEYQTWGKASAEDFLHGRFGEPIVAPEPYKADGKMDWERDIVIKRPDAAEIRHRNFLQDRLENARGIIGEPKKGETVADYMARYNLKNADVNESIYNHLKNENMINGGAGVKAEVWSIVDKMPSSLKQSLMENFAANKRIGLGYVKIFFGDRGGVKEGIKAVFDYQGEINPADIKIKGDGSVIYENAFGKRGFDLSISREKIGVDGPGWNNLPKNKMSIDNLAAAKKFILSGKTVEDNIQDYLKTEKGGQVDKNVVDQLGEKKPETAGVKSVSEKLGDKGKIIKSVPKAETGKIIDLSTENSPEENLPKEKPIDLSTENQGSLDVIKNIEAGVAKADLKHFNELVLKMEKMSDNDLAEAVKAAPDGKEKSLVAKAIAKVMELRNLEDEKDF